MEDDDEEEEEEAEAEGCWEDGDAPPRKRSAPGVNVVAGDACAWLCSRQEEGPPEPSKVDTCSEVVAVVPGDTETRQRQRT